LHQQEPATKPTEEPDLSVQITSTGRNSTKVLSAITKNLANEDILLLSLLSSFVHPVSFAQSPQLRLDPPTDLLTYLKNAEWDF